MLISHEINMLHLLVLCSPVEDNKPGNAVAAQGRNGTRVLRDIGNPTIAPPVEAQKLPTQTCRPLNKSLSLCLTHMVGLSRISRPLAHSC